MTTIVASDPLVEKLMQVEGKAEIVGGRILKIMPTGGKPSYAASRILLALAMIEDDAGGIAFGGNAAFLCDLPDRKSFSPDAAFYLGPQIEMGFLPIPPVFAVEVRSENDYGRRAEAAITQKIADYFAAGTLVVWDVDLLNEEVVAKYSLQNPTEPQVFRRGDLADAAPAVSGWSMPLGALFAPSRAR